MTQKPDNPQAFARAYSEEDVGIDDREYHFAQQGMTLRDYFAAAAVSRLYGAQSGSDADGFAKTAYEIADAMLKAREATHD